MRFLHTSDWHLGKNIENHPRDMEQIQIIENIIEICNEQNVEIILNTGDIFDTVNPSAKAETIFYESIRSLTDNGNRTLIIIAGNHDNAERLTACSDLLKDYGVIISGYPDNIIKPGKYGKAEVIQSLPGFFKLKKNNQIINFINLPYPGEKRLNLLLKGNSIKELRENYSDTIQEIFKDLSENFVRDEINITLSHLFVRSGIKTDTERNIELGGIYAVDPEVFPESDYIALGHLHRPQKLGKNIYYSGSILQYSLQERTYSKSVNIIDINDNKTEVNPVYLRNICPVEKWEASSIDDAINICEKNKDRDVWAYLYIQSEDIIKDDTIRKLKKIKPDLLSIVPVFDQSDLPDFNVLDHEEESIHNLFKEYFKENYNLSPDQEIMDLFEYISSEQENINNDSSSS